MPQAKILVVEDQRAVAGALRMRLRGLGYVVADIATSGADAVEKAGALSPDLILMDIQLGEGIDGIEAAHRIREQVDIPVIYVTAHADPGLLERARKTEPAGFINKPFTTKDLLTTIDLALHRHRHRDNGKGPGKAVREAIVTTDREGLITYINGDAESITGWSRNIVIGQPLCSAMANYYGIPVQDADRLVNQVFDSGRDEILRETSDHGDEAERDFLTPLSDAKGFYYGVALRLAAAPTPAEPVAAADDGDAEYQQLIDMLPLAALLISGTREVLYANATARDIADGSSAFQLDGQRLKISTPERAVEFEQHLDALNNAPGLHGQRLTVIAETDGRPTTVGVLRRFGSLAGTQPNAQPGAGSARYALIIYDRAQHAPLSETVLRHLYGLTRSEIRLVQQLVGGDSLEECAAALDISVNTARTHLKHIFHKTTVRRQSELIHVLETGPAGLRIDIDI